MYVRLITIHKNIKDMEYIAAQSALICHGNEGKQIDNKELLSRIIKLKHGSILEHINLTFNIEDLPRYVLQELARHRHVSMSVESTRHTLRKKLNDDEWYSKFFGSLSDDEKEFMRFFRSFADKHPLMPNDELKKFLPEFFPTNLFLTVNVRELRHILDLRTDPRALKEFRELARKLFEAVPEEYKYLLEDCVHEA